MIRPWTLQLPALILRMLALLVFWYTIMDDLTWRSFVDSQSDYIFGRNSHFLRILKTEHNYTFEDIRTRTQIQSKLYLVILCLSSIWYVLQEPLWSKVWSVPIVNAFLVLLGSIVMMSSVEGYKFIYKDLVGETKNRMFSRIFLSCFQMHGMMLIDDVVLNETERAVMDNYCVCQDFLWKNVSALLALLSGILLIFSCLVILINNVEGNFAWRNDQERAGEILNLELMPGQNNPTDPTTQLVLIPCVEIIEIDQNSNTNANANAAGSSNGTPESETEIKAKKIQQILTKNDHQNNNGKISIPIPKPLVCTT